MITIPSGYANGELRILARHNGLVQVGCMRRPAAHYYKATLWPRAGERPMYSDRDLVIIGPNLAAVRQALRDRVRLQGKWWT